MIDVSDGVFRLTTRTTSLWFRVTAHGHLEEVHYGVRLPLDQDPQALAIKRTAEIGSSIAYDEADPFYCLDNIPLEWSGTGCGDYRRSPIEVVGADGIRATDFRYRGHRLTPGAAESETLPGARAGQSEASKTAGTDGTRETSAPDRRGDATAPEDETADEAVQTLVVELVDEAARLELALEYIVFPATDVIARRTRLTNRGEQPVSIRRLDSMMMDLPDRAFRLLTLHGGWIKETHLEDRPLSYGLAVNSSTTGASSNRNNPGFLLAEGRADETRGRVFGFNLVYSGNHAGTVERSPHDLVRVTLGVNPEGFDWRLAPGETFETPQAVMTFAADGLGGVSRHFHDFVNRHIVRGDWRGRARPVVYNNWEATFFDFTAGKLLKLARQAKQLGAELFVMDDGWFGRRDSDRAGLGDYSVNRRKFPDGLPRFADQIRGLGLDFGIWMEPEMVNQDSDLYRAHPDWAITTPGRQARLGRHQLVLDLTRPEVRDHIVDQVSHIIDTTGASYVKWDFNRNLTDLYSPGLAGRPGPGLDDPGPAASRQGEFAHRYILGLYDLLRRIFGPRPQVLLESCASGGNRFDLGMLCFSPQIWSSDDTDPVERLAIQGGLSLLYPPSAMGAHVSEAPHQQTLRDTPLTTRFNVAAFGCLGYELDLKLLSRVERAEIREQIAFYKAHRMTLQYGRHHRTDRDTGAKANKVVWTMVAQDGSEAVTGLFQTLTQASEGFDRLPVDGLDPQTRYHIATRPQSLFVHRFGGLVKHILPVTLNPDGRIMTTVDHQYRLTDCVEEYDAYGAALADGIALANQFMGSNYNEHTRLLGDFGSSLYLTTRVGEKN